MQIDLSNRRLTLEQALEDKNKELKHITELDITEDAQVFYDDEIERISASIKELNNNIEEIIKLQDFNITLKSNTYVITPAIFIINGSDTSLPDISFKVFDKNDNEITDLTFRSVICDQEVTFIYDEDAYIISDVKCEFIPPTNNKEFAIYDGDGRDGDDKLDQAKFEQLLSRGINTFEGYEFDEMNSVKTYRQDEITFNNCKFKNCSNLFKRVTSDSSYSSISSWTNNLWSVTFNNCEINNSSQSMFESCSTIKEIEFNNVTWNVKSMDKMFQNCTSVNVLDFKTTNNVSNPAPSAKQMFMNCTSLQQIVALENFCQMLRISGSSDMFKGCTSIYGKYGQKYKKSEVNYDRASYIWYITDHSNRIRNKDALRNKLAATRVIKDTTIECNIKGFDILDLTSLTFKNCLFWDPSESFRDKQKLESIVFENCEFRKSMLHMFHGDVKLKNIVFDNCDTSNVTLMNRMFEDCHAIDSLDLSSFDTSNVTLMNWMFKNCNISGDLNLSSFHTPKLKQTYQMFCGCGIRKIDLSSFTTESLEEVGGMFLDMKSVVQTVNIGNMLFKKVNYGKKCINGIQGETVWIINKSCVCNSKYKNVGKTEPTIGKHLYFKFGKFSDWFGPIVTAWSEEGDKFIVTMERK